MFFFFFQSTYSVCQVKKNPLINGSIIKSATGIYSHADPKYGISFSSDKGEVFAVMQGKVIDILVSPDGLSTLIVRSIDTIVVYKSLMNTKVRKKDVVQVGQNIGIANRNASQKFVLDISIWRKKERIDPLLFFGDVLE